MFITLKLRAANSNVFRIESLPVKAKKYAHMFLSPAIDPSIHTTLSYIFCHIELINHGEQNFALYNHIHHQTLGLGASPLILAIAACLEANGKYCC